MNDYSHLNIKVSNSFLNKIKNKLPLEDLPNFYFIIRFLYSFRLIRGIARNITRLENYTLKENSETNKIINSVHEKHLKQKNQKANDFESGFGYDEFEEIKYIFHYYKQIKNNFEGKNLSESKLLYENIINICSDLIPRLNVKNFTNFGSMYAYTDSILAKKFPETIFHCADRSKYTKILMEKIFNNFSNMKFVDGDIFNFLDNKYQNSMFFSTRTALIMPQDFLDELYSKVYLADYKYVVMFEQIGISHETCKAYEFSDHDKKSLSYRWGMYLHNYPGILKKAGYKVIESKLIKTNHPYEDYRFLYILAKKN